MMVLGMFPWHHRLSIFWALKKTEMTPILDARNITKRFPGVLANDRISFSLNEGEILAFLGENGAGKSTLMNILYGLYTPDEGEVTVRGKPAEIHEPNDAIALGIGMVHQHFQLVPVFTVAENIVLGTEPTRFAFSWQTLGIISGAAALLSFIGGIFGSSGIGQWLLAALSGGATAAGMYILLFLLGKLSRQKARIYISIVTAVCIALFVTLALIQGAAGRIPLLIPLALLFAAASYPAMRVFTTTLDQRAAVRQWIREH
jgi:hypothetical protein